MTRPYFTDITNFPSWCWLFLTRKQSESCAASLSSDFSHEISEWYHGFCTRLSLSALAERLAVGVGLKYVFLGEERKQQQEYQVELVVSLGVGTTSCWVLPSVSSCIATETEICTKLKLEYYHTKLVHGWVKVLIWYHGSQWVASVPVLNFTLACAIKWQSCEYYEWMKM